MGHVQRRLGDTSIAIVTPNRRLRFTLEGTKLGGLRDDLQTLIAQGETAPAEAG